MHNWRLNKVIFNFQLSIVNYQLMKTFLLCAIIIALCILMLSVRILFKKNGQFVKTHVSQSKAMRERGIGCVQGQDFAERHKKKRIKEY